MALLLLCVLLAPLIGLAWLISLQSEVSNLKLRLSKLEKSEADVSLPTSVQMPSTPVPPAPVQKVSALSVNSVSPAPIESVSVVQIFSWVGGFALLLGIGFVIKYALDNQLLSPQIRITGSVIFGLGLWLTGLLLKKQIHQTTACTLCASGLSIAYLAFFAAHAYYAFVGLHLAFILLLITSLLAFGTSLWKNAQGIGIFAQIIGFMVPFLLHAENPNYFFLLSYTAFIALASIGAAWKRQWNGLLVGSLVFVGISQLVVLCQMSLSQLNLLFGFCVLFGLLFIGISYQKKEGTFLIAFAAVTWFLVGGYVARCVGDIPAVHVISFLSWTILLMLLYSLPVFLFFKRWGASISAWISLLLSAGAGALYVYIVCYCTYHVKDGSIPFLFMCIYGLVQYGVQRKLLPAGAPCQVGLVGLGLLNIFFLTWGIICQFEHAYLTLLLATEGCVFLFLAKIKQMSWLHGVSLGLVGIALAKLFLADIWILEMLTRIAVLIGVAIVLIVGAFIYQNLRSHRVEKKADPK